MAESFPHIFVANYYRDFPPALSLLGPLMNSRNRAADSGGFFHFSSTPYFPYLFLSFSLGGWEKGGRGGDKLGEGIKRRGADLLLFLPHLRPRTKGGKIGQSKKELSSLYLK